MDDSGATHSDDGGPEEAGSDPNKRMDLVVFTLFFLFSTLCFTALVVKKVAPLIASKKVTQIKISLHEMLLTSQSYWLTMSFL